MRFLTGYRRNIFVLMMLAACVAGAYLLTCGQHRLGSIRNVVIISIDTCRADYLSCYGYRRPTTPNIDALARATATNRSTLAEEIRSRLTLYRAGRPCHEDARVLLPAIR